jgi:hypothetical protein
VSVENAADTTNLNFKPAEGAGSVTVYPVPDIKNVLPLSAPDKVKSAVSVSYLSKIRVTSLENVVVVDIIIY